MPDFIGPRDLKEGRHGRRSAPEECVQALHLEPYANEGEAIARMQAVAKTKGLAFRGLHHECACPSGLKPG